MKDSPSSLAPSRFCGWSINFSPSSSLSFVVDLHHLVNNWWPKLLILDDIPLIKNSPLAVPSVNRRFHPSIISFVDTWHTHTAFDLVDRSLRIYVDTSIYSFASRPNLLVDQINQFIEPSPAAYQLYY